MRSGVAWRCAVRCGAVRRSYHGAGTREIPDADDLALPLVAGVNYSFAPERVIDAAQSGQGRAIMKGKEENPSDPAMVPRGS